MLAHTKDEKYERIIHPCNARFFRILSIERFEIEEVLIKNCGWVWWHENVLVISDRPSVINRDEQGRLHCETGPSIAYRDGWQLHHWHGTSIPREWIDDRKSLTPTLARPLH